MGRHKNVGSPKSIKSVKAKKVGRISDSQKVYEKIRAIALKDGRVSENEFKDILSFNKLTFSKNNKYNLIINRIKTSFLEYRSINDDNLIKFEQLAGVYNPKNWEKQEEDTLSSSFSLSDNKEYKELDNIKEGLLDDGNFLYKLLGKLLLRAFAMLFVVSIAVIIGFVIVWFFANGISCLSGLGCLGC